MGGAVGRPYDRVLPGVCAGLGDLFWRSANVVRAIFVLSCLLPGAQFLLYVALWIAMPAED